METLLKVIPSYPQYCVDTFGNVFNALTFRCLKPYTKRNGYKQLCLRSSGKYKTVLVHRLVAESFLGDYDLDVNHKNGDKGDNRYQNLEFVTKAMNQQHRFNVLGKGLKPIILVKSGISFEFNSHKSASEYTGLSQSNISALSLGRRKTAKGWSTLFTEMK